MRKLQSERQFAIQVVGRQKSMSFRKVLAAMVYRERCETAEKHDFQRSLKTK